LGADVSRGGVRIAQCACERAHFFLQSNARGVGVDSESDHGILSRLVCPFDFAQRLAQVLRALLLLLLSEPRHLLG
jgi:hypothetical protein